jgi:D-glycero-alpha-D-manno-heptose-7-phosphate kinase
MIITRTPLRMSFVGGGSDIFDFHRLEKGAVISTAIDKFVYVTINKKFDEHIRVSYSKTEEVSSTNDIEHPLVRACLNFTNVRGGIEVTSIADVPSRGTGLGSSSAFTVGLLHALHAYAGRYCDAARLGKEASHIEIDICKEPIGKQDQYAAAFGGFNIIEFHPTGEVDVLPLACAPASIENLRRNLITFYTGVVRSTSSILGCESPENVDQEEKRRILSRMVRLVYDFRDVMFKGRLDAIGEILHENWVLKSSLSPAVSSSRIDEWYERGRKAGALGGKILGAGGGGFLTFYAPSNRHDAIRLALSELRLVDFGFCRSGSSIIFYQ